MAEDDSDQGVDEDDGDLDAASAYGEGEESNHGIVGTSEVSDDDLLEEAIAEAAAARDGWRGSVAPVAEGAGAGTKGATSAARSASSAQAEASADGEASAAGTASDDLEG